MVKIAFTPEVKNLEDLLQQMATPEVIKLQKTFEKIEAKNTGTPVKVEDIDKLINDTHAFYAAKRSR